MIGARMQIPRPSDYDKERFVEAMAQFEGVDVKAMFGNLGAFVNGNMFAGLYGSDLGVKLTDVASREQLATVAGTGPYGPEERPMGGWTTLPADWIEQQELVSRWARLAFEQVGTLPPKAQKPRKKA
jgi:TfoX/Sxy family transcriptional regulator of competence genes